jgi:hypothetical protein
MKLILKSTISHDGYCSFSHINTKSRVSVWATADRKSYSYVINHIRSFIGSRDTTCLVKHPRDSLLEISEIDC